MKGQKWAQNNKGTRGRDEKVIHARKQQLSYHFGVEDDLVWKEESSSRAACEPMGQRACWCSLPVKRTARLPADGQVRDHVSTFSPRPSTSIRR